MTLNLFGNRIIKAKAITTPANQISMKVLLIDDDNVTLNLMGVYIRGYSPSCDVTLFSTSARALEYLKASQDNYPDVLVADLQMPGMNGFELIREVNEYFRSTYGGQPPFRIILHTSFLGPEQTCFSETAPSNRPCFLKRFLKPGDEITCKELSIEACIPKPLNEYKLKHIFNGRELLRSAM